MVPPRTPPPPTMHEWVRCLGLFAATTVSVFFSYSWWWSSGDVWTDSTIARDSALFALGLMGILGSHEAGHYIVARRHGMDQTLPFFIPFPMAFGTLGAIIRLRTPPPSRTALLEVGAAGPLAGFAVALVVLAVGLLDTTSHVVPELVMEWPPPAPEAPGPFAVLLGQMLESVASVLPDAEESAPGLPLMIMANPPIMDWLGWLLLGAPPGRYDSLSPLGLAGWAGCFLTAMNLLPIGQLDGGHVLRSLAPRIAHRVSSVGVILVAIAGFFTWSGWTVWAGLLWAMGAWRGVPAAHLAPPRPRARWVAGATLLTFVACFMPTPLAQETFPIAEVRVRTPDGEEVPPEVFVAWYEEQRPKP